MLDNQLGVIIVISESASALPLEHTAVTGKITGPVANIQVEQRFGNPFTTPIELEYLFPLPHDAAITAYQIRIKDRTINAEIQELRVARETYEEAKSAGKRASLLEQRRPNLFAVKVGNIQPGDAILTTICFEQRLHYRDDSYQFVFPMGITPKYHADPLEAAKVDAPIASPVERIAPVSIKLDIEAGVEAGDPVSSSHSVNVKRLATGHFEVAVQTQPTKDFVLHYAVAGTKIKTGVWVSHGKDADTGLITIVPPRLTGEIQPVPREFIFVLDRSGSMSTQPIQQARNALRACLRTLNEGDTFAIQVFDDKIEWFADQVLPLTQEHVEKADRWLDGINSRGGTEIVPAIQAALSLPHDKNRLRYLVFLTDGAVSAEDHAYQVIQQKRGEARIFTFGIGSSVNRALLSKMADLGRGKAEFLRLQDDIEQAIIRFADRISYPVMQNIQLAWDGVQVWDTYPSRLPDLYVGEPLDLVTRIKGHGTGKLIGQLAGREVSISFALPESTLENADLDRLWAKARIESLNEDNTLNAETKRQQIISLSLTHRVLTAFTAFVGVDSEVVADKDSVYVKVAQPLPNGLNRAGFGLANRHDPLQARLSQMADKETRITSLDDIELRVSFQDRVAIPMFTSLANVVVGGLEKLSSLGKKWQEDLDTTDDSAMGTTNDAKLDSVDAAPAYKTPSPAKSTSSPIRQESIPDLIKWLARTQNISGSWGSGLEEAERTAAALIAFIRAGHTTRTGDYRRALSKAVVWLKKATLVGFPVFLRWRAFTELEKAEGEHHLLPELALGTPNDDLQHAAIGDSVTVPITITTLDDLRIAALINGTAVVPLTMLDGDHSDLVKTWAALGKPS